MFLFDIDIDVIRVQHCVLQKQNKMSVMQIKNLLETISTKD